MYSYETMKQGGYKYIKNLGGGEHLLLDLSQAEDYPYRLEVWGCSKNHAGYALRYKNTHLEFCRSYNLGGKND